MLQWSSIIECSLNVRYQNMNFNLIELSGVLQEISLCKSGHIFKST